MQEDGACRSEGRSKSKLGEEERTVWVGTLKRVRERVV